MFNLDTFNSFIYGSVSEVIAQQIDLWNASSRGAIVMSDGYNNIGDTDHTTFWKEISGVVRRRDAYGSGAVAAKQLTMDDLISVKVAAGTPPIEIPPSEFNWIQKDPEEGGFVIGEQIGMAMPQDKLNTGIAACVAALTQVGAPSAEGALDGVLLDATVGGTVTTSAAVIDRIMMNDGAALFGDRSMAILAWVMHSTTMHKIFGDNLSNTQQLFEIGNVAVIQDGFGRIFFMTDSPALSAGSGEYYTMGLTEGAIRVETNADLVTNLETSNGDENILRTWQAEWSYNLSLKGMKYVSASASPSDAVLATPASWGQAVTDIKNLPGVLIKHRNKAA